MKKRIKQNEDGWYEGGTPNSRDQMYFAVSRLGDKVLALSIHFNPETGLAKLREMVTIPLISYSSNVEVAKKEIVLDETSFYRIENKDSLSERIHRIMKHEETHLTKLAHSLLS